MHAIRSRMRAAGAGILAGLMLPLGLALAQTPAAPPTHTDGGAQAAGPQGTRAAAADLEPAVNTSDTAARAPAPTAAPAAATGGGATTKTAKTGKAMDRLELDTTQITGNRELPKVLYIVPWKRSDLGDLVGKPANSLLDEVLQPVDRDVFKRENRYYRAVMPKDGATSGAAAGPGSRTGGGNP